jgi:tRNA threonylcarbamoyladenosine biosynthesis protein TsaB
MLEVYHAAYAERLNGLEEVIPPGLHRPAEVPLPEGEGWVGCGTGFGAHRAALAARYGGRLAAIRPDVFPSAAAVVRLAAPRFAAGEGGDPATAAPVYLRDRVALRTDER